MSVFDTKNLSIKINSKLLISLQRIECRYLDLINPLTDSREMLETNFGFGGGDIESGKSCRGAEQVE